MRGRLTAGALAASLAAAGCTAERPVSPLPTEAVTTTISVAPPRAALGPSPSRSSPSTSPSPSPSPPVSPRPTEPPPTRTHPTPPPTKATNPTRTTSSCEGAVVHTIDVAKDELALVPSFCLATGAVLRVVNIGPGEVTTDAPDRVDQRYEAGVVEIRFVRTGTVVVTIPQQGQPHDVTVVVR
jgi:hypothetical protein